MTSPKRENINSPPTKRLRLRGRTSSLEVRTMATQRKRKYTVSRARPQAPHQALSQAVRKRRRETRRKRRRRGDGSISSSTQYLHGLRTNTRDKSWIRPPPSCPIFPLFIMEEKKRNCCKAPEGRPTYPRVPPLHHQDPSSYNARFLCPRIYPRGAIYRSSNFSSELKRLLSVEQSTVHRHSSDF